MRRLLAVSLLSAAVLCSGPARVFAQDAGTDNSTPTTVDVNGENGDPADSTPVNLDVPTVPVSAASSIPVGCDPLIVPQAIAVVTFSQMDGPVRNGKSNTDPRLAKTTRFNIDGVRAGSLDGFGNGKQIDIDYGADKQFLVLGHTYVAALATDPVTGTLTSKLKIQPKMFGGNQVIGVDDKPNNCPQVVDTIITTELDGKSVDTGMLSKFKADKKDLALAFAKPAAVVFAILIALVLLKHFGMAMWQWVRRFRFGVQKTRARGKRIKAARKAQAAHSSAGTSQPVAIEHDELVSHD